MARPVRTARPGGYRGRDSGDSLGGRYRRLPRRGSIRSAGRTKAEIPAQSELKANADCSRPRGADARAGMAGQPLKRALQDVGHDLHPDPARRPAVGDDEALRLVADLVHDLDVMGDRISVGLEKSAPEMADVVRKRKAIEGRARVRIVDRRLFAKKIRRDDKPLAAGGPRLGQPVQPLMDRQAGLIRRLFFAGGELADEPVERRAARRHASVGDEQTRLQMIVEKEARIGARMIGGGQDIDRAAEFEQHVARVDDARAKRGGDMVGGAADDRRSRLLIRFPPRRAATLCRGFRARRSCGGSVARGICASATSASSIAPVLRSTKPASSAQFCSMARSPVRRQLI